VRRADSENDICHSWNLRNSGCEMQNANSGWTDLGAGVHVEF
jgi:hypothetical protein